MNILIIGGTGFLGYHACRELLGRGHHVTLMGLPPAPASGVFPADVDILLEDINQYDESALRRLFITFDPAQSQRILGYSGGGLEQAWKETVEACPQKRGLKSLSKYVSRMKKTIGR